MEVYKCDYCGKVHKKRPRFIICEECLRPIHATTHDLYMLRFQNFYRELISQGILADTIYASFRYYRSKEFLDSIRKTNRTIKSIFSNGWDSCFLYIIHESKRLIHEAEEQYDVRCKMSFELMEASQENDHSISCYYHISRLVFMDWDGNLNIDRVDMEASCFDIGMKKDKPTLNRQDRAIRDHL